VSKTEKFLRCVLKMLRQMQRQKEESMEMRMFNHFNVFERVVQHLESTCLIIPSPIVCFEVGYSVVYSLAVSSTSDTVLA
jgi:hypothetical protein